MDTRQDWGAFGMSVDTKLPTLITAPANVPDAAAIAQFCAEGEWGAFDAFPALPDDDARYLSLVSWQDEVYVFVGLSDPARAADDQQRVVDWLGRSGLVAAASYRTPEGFVWSVVTKAPSRRQLEPALAVV